MDDIPALLDGVGAAAHADGGWSYLAGQTPQVEPTCLALLALAPHRDRYRAAVEKGLAFLERCAGPDGGYWRANGRAEASWPTALALFVQAALAVPAAQITRTASRLLLMRGEKVELTAEEKGVIQDIDTSIVGWSWAAGTFSWVEPTAWACLALRRSGYGDHPRVRDGRRLLLDRAFEEGGINYGNRNVFGRSTEPILGPTVGMLLALQGHAPEKRVTAALAYLRREAAATDDLENLCWARLALDLYDDPQAPQSAELDTKIRAAHAARAAAGWTTPSPSRDALAALALSCKQHNAFRLPPAGDAAGARPVVALPRLPGRSLKERVHAAVQGLAVRAAGALRPVPSTAAVHIARASSYDEDLAGILDRQFQALPTKPVLQGKRVVIKPNLVEYRPTQVVNTHPRVVGAVIELCKRHGAAEVVVAEGPGHWRNVEQMVRASGLGAVLQQHGVPFVDLNHDDPVRVVNMGRCTGLEHLWLPRTVHRAEVFISVPKLKTHHWAGVTLSLKNLFGIMPGTCYGWPKNELHWRGIENSIIDINLTRTPDLAVVDGIVGMEGDGPLAGTAKPLGVLVLGADPLAVDATCARLMKLDPLKIPHLWLGQQRRLGQLAENQIKQLGEAIEPLAQPFETVPQFHQLYVGRSG